MQFAIAAVSILPAVVDAVAVVATVKSTVQTARWIGSWAVWAVNGSGNVKDVKDDGAWQMVEQREHGGAVVDAELVLSHTT